MIYVFFISVKATPENYEDYIRLAILSRKIDATNSANINIGYQFSDDDGKKFVVKGVLNGLASAKVDPLKDIKMAFFKLAKGEEPREVIGVLTDMEHIVKK